jgi:hypothetical protein
MAKRILVNADVWEEMILKLREYKEANYFLNKQVKAYNEKYGKLEEKKDTLKG